MAQRRESVRLSLEDDFTPGMARAAGATAALNQQLGRLDGNYVQGSRSSNVFIRDVQRMGREASGTEKQIDKLSGRLRIVADLAPLAVASIAPLGGVGLAGIAGLASQMGFAAVAGGVLIGSFGGLGDALKAMTKAGVEPSTENLGKLSEEMNKLAPETQAFVGQIYNLMPAFRALRETGRASMMPGFSEAMGELEDLLPKIARIMTSVGSEIGDITADVAGSFNSGRWSDFLSFIETETPEAIRALSTIVGDLAHGMAELWMAFDPLNDDFNSWLIGIADGFDRWATGLSKTDGFAEFIDYVRTNGPQVAETVGSLANALIQVVQAAAPLGGPVLAGLEAVADVVGALADSDLGAPIMAGVTALGLLNRALAMTKIQSAGGLFGGVTALGQSAKSGFGTMRADVANVSDSLVAFGSNADRAAASSARLKGQLATVGKSAALIGGLAIAGSGAADGLNLTNAASLGLAGAMTGPLGAAIGGTIGLGMDLAAVNDDVFDSLDKFRVGLENLSGTATTDELAALSVSAQDARDKLNDLADTLNNGQTSSLGGVFAGAKNAVEGIFGRDDYEEAYYEKIGLEKQYAAAIRETLAASASAASQTEYRRMLEAETAALEDNIGAMVEYREQRLAAANAELGYRSSILDAKDALEENGRTLDKNTREGIANRSALLGMAAAWNGQSEEVKGAEGAHRNAIRTFVAVAEQMGMSRKAARDYADALFEIPAERKTAIKLETDVAFQKARAIKAELASIDRNIDVYVNIRRPNAGGFGPQVTSSADGGSVPKSGKPYADRYPYLLADGEEVISNRRGQADKHRSLLKRINAGLADGGTAGKGAGSADERLAVLQAEQSIRELVRSLNADGKNRFGPNAREIARVELEAAKTALKAAEANLGAALRAKESEAAAAMVDAANLQLEAAQSQLDAAQSLFDATKAQSDAFTESVSGNFDNNIFGNGLSGAMLQLSADTNDANAFKGLLQALSGSGLDGAAFAALASSGDMGTAQQLFDSGPGGIAAFEAAIAGRASAQGGVGGFAADLQFGAQLAAQAAAVQQQTIAVQAQTAAVLRMEQRLAVLETVGAQVKDGARQGTREGNNDRNTDTRQRGRVGR